MARVLGRIRLSRLTDESTSEDRQRQTIEAYAAMHGHKIAGWAVDLDVSGSISPFEAPEFGPWLNDRADEFDVIVSWKLDRLGRGLFDLNDLFKWCHQNAKTLACVADPIDLSSSVGQLVASVMAAVAQMELEAIQVRTRASRAELRRQGRYAGGRPPYGYRPAPRVGGGFDLERNPETAPIVVRIFEAVCRESVSSVCRGLNAEKIPAPTGGPWNIPTITAMVRARWALGYVETVAEDKSRTIVLADDGAPVRRDPLVSADLHDRANAALDAGQRPAGVKNPTALLAEIARCDECSAKMHAHRGQTKKPNGKAYPYAYYKCPKKHVSVKMTDTEEKTSEMLLSEIGDLRRTERVRVTGDNDQRVTDLSVQIADLSREQAALDDEDPAIAAAISRLKRERKALKDAGPRWETRDLGETYRQAWERFDTAERRRLLLDAGIVVRVSNAQGLNLITDIPTLYGAVSPDTADQIPEGANYQERQKIATGRPIEPTPWEPGYVETYEPEMPPGWSADVMQD